MSGTAPPPGDFTPPDESFPWRFRNDSDDEICGASCQEDHELGPFACMRRKGHEGVHIAMVCDAADADGVCFGCREPLGKPHKTDCDAHKEHRK